MNAALVSVPEPGDYSQSVQRIFLHDFILYGTSIIAAKHLTNIRREPSKLASHQIFACLLISTFPLAELIISRLRTWRAWRRTGLQTSKQYYVCAPLDMRAVSVSGDNEDSIPLIHYVSVIDPRNLRYEYKSYKIQLAVQVLALLISAIQALLTINLWI